MNNPSQKPFYLVTGFHRSGTSMLAQALLRNGMDMGSELMGATFSNPLGHVEDMPAVRLHDKIYTLNGCDWRYHDSSQMIKPIWLQNYIKSYISKRREQGGNRLGVKDPRAVHFLKDWQIAGEGAVRFVFIYRHWRYAAHSLLNRHSRHMLNSALPVTAHRLNVSFWQQPTLAYEMWYTANARIRDFYQQHKSKALLLSQHGLVEAGTIPAIAAEKISLDPADFELQSFRKDLLSERVPKSSEAMLDKALIAKLDALQRELDELSDVAIPYKNESNVFSRSIPTAISDKIVGNGVALKNVFSHCDINLSELTWSELSGVLLRLPQQSMASKHYADILRREGAPSKELHSLAKVAHMQDFWVITRVLKIRANLMDCIENLRNPWIFSNWQVGVDNDRWYELRDDQVEKGNPFSLRALEQLPSRYRAAAEGFDKQQLSVSSLQRLDSDATECALEVLLMSSLLTLDELRLVAARAKALELTYVEEFALLKAFRLQTSEQAEVNGVSSSTIAHQLFQLYLTSGQKELAQLLFNETPAVSGMGELQQSDDGKTEPKGASTPNLKHRFAVVPHNLPYSDILALSQSEPARGRKLDVLNQRLNFLVKSNIDWLTEATNCLSSAAGQSLAESIYAHWHRLWPTAVLEYVITGAPTEGSNPIECFAMKPITPETSRIILYVRNPAIESLAALTALLVDLELDVSVSLLCSPKEIQGLTPHIISLISSSERLAIKRLDESFVIHKHGNIWMVNNDADPTINHWQGLVDGANHTNEIARTKQVMQWYSLLGFEFGLSMLSHCSLAKALIASYHPADLPELQGKPLFYPDSATFWVNSSAAKALCNLTEKGPHRYLLKCLNVLQEMEAEIAFTHQNNDFHLPST